MSSIDRTYSGIGKKEPFLLLWFIAHSVSMMGWIGVALGVLGLFLVSDPLGHSDVSGAFKIIFASLGFGLGGGAVRVLIAIERNTRKS